MVLGLTASKTLVLSRAWDVLRYLEIRSAIALTTPDLFDQRFDRKGMG
ncbi:MAG: hypothetical protein RI910_1856 [Verrucomicrobiota bacterium]